MTAEHDRLTEASRILRGCEETVRLMRALSWSPTIKARFFAHGARRMPRVTYPRRSQQSVHEGVAAARRLIQGRSLALDWLNRQADMIELSARMVEALGTADFHRLSAEVYGLPTTPLVDGKSTSLQLARRIDRVLERLDPGHLGSDPEPLSATELARAIQRSVDALLGHAAPRVLVVQALSAKATSSTKFIRIRADATFTKEDVQQLVMHEAMVHVTTTLNGRRQRRLPILAVRHPGTTRTQEGLAVFCELMSGALGPSRLRRLANRVLAIQRSMEGADFMELYRFFVDQTGDPSQSFEDARRIVRGSLLDGGAPFTKDGVYLDGLVRVHNFMRAVVELTRPDLIPLLFCGKMDIEDIPAIYQLAQEGLVLRPRYVPPWVEDRRFIVSYLTYTGFLSRIRLKPVREHYTRLLSSCRGLRDDFVEDGTIPPSDSSPGAHGAPQG